MSKLVFIVDDEQSIAKLLSFWVKDKWGYEVEIFSNSESMLKKISFKTRPHFAGYYASWFGWNRNSEKNKTN